jgi:endonuclease/exonuclease/phosphatase family metal-dependent hydrolase
MRHRTALLAAALALLVPVAGAGTAGQAATAKTAQVSVMTRNLFLGADLIPLATAGKGDPFRQAATGLLNEIRGSDPNGRMKLVAGEIAKARPDVVGLQEVSLWRTGPPGAAPTTVVADYLKTITAELARRHVRYRVATKKLGLALRAPTSSGVDVSLAIGDAVLVREGVKSSSARSGLYKSQLTVPTQELGPVRTNRSYNTLDVTVRGARLHVVNAHLEAYDATIRLKQAQELVAGPLRSARTTILLGDLNSGPDLPKPEDRPPYAAIAKAGFVPERTTTPSCCNDTLDKLHWDHNVDWIMARPRVGLVRSTLTGKERTAGGLMPADHGGVISVLSVPRG